MKWDLKIIILTPTSVRWMSASFVVQEQRHGDSQQEEEQKVEEEGYAFNLSVPIGL